MFYLPILVRRKGLGWLFEVGYLIMVYGLTRYYLEGKQCLDPESKVLFQCQTNMSLVVLSVDVCLMLADAAVFQIWPWLSGKTVSISNRMDGIVYPPWEFHDESLKASLADLMCLVIFLQALFVVRMGSEEEGPVLYEEFELMNLCNFIILRSEYYYRNYLIVRTFILLARKTLAIYMMKDITFVIVSKELRKILPHFIGYTAAIYAYNFVI